jgi:hypothetical protein
MAGVCVTLVLLSVCGSALAQVNSWTLPSSAPWESMSWSLGVLPGSAQSVVITNAGYKAVGISSSTVSGYPDSLTLDSLTVSAPTNGYSTLLLNYFGTGTPLNVLDRCTIGTNGSIVNLYSAFQVQSGLRIDGGQYIEEGGFTIVTNGGATVDDGGAMNITNAIFEGSIELLLGGTVTQVDGQTSGEIVVYYGGSYNFLSGTVTGKCLVRGYAAKFNQYGGTNAGNIMVGDGTSDGSGQYTIYNGLADESDINIGKGESGYGFFEQYGGTVITPSLEVGGGGDGAANASGDYDLTNGTLQVGRINLESGGVRQSGGKLITTNGIYLQGVPDFDYGPALYVDYNLSGGELCCPAISVSLNGSFYQTGGTNTVSGDLSIHGSTYTFSGGLLLASNVSISPGQWGLPGYSEYDGALQQSSGNLYVTNTLWNLDFYSLSGGSAYASNIVLAGTLSVSSPGLIVNPGNIQFAGRLQLSGGVIENLGQMLLSSNSVIDFTTGGDRVSFLNSAAMNWNPASLLAVIHWDGSTNGGGSDQLLFGNGSGGLAPAQLRQIVFVNPAGFPAGNYAANILPGGEVVPLGNPILSWQSVQGQLVVSWAGQATLQSSTNVIGPYVDVPNASSPYTNSSQGPDGFFRLRLNP